MEVHIPITMLVNKPIKSGIMLEKLEDFGSKPIQEKLCTYITNYYENHKATSTITQLAAILNFMKFLRKNVSRSASENFEEIKEQILIWKQSFRKGASGEMAFKNADVVSKLDIAILESSNLYKECDSLIEKVDNEDLKLTCTDHCKIRSYLTIQGFIRNTNRP